MTYHPRPSAYVLLQREDGALATTRSPHGLFLPGGGVDPGETPEQAAIREAREECGFVVGELQLVCVASQFVRSRKYNADYEKLSSFFKARLLETAEPTEPSHELLWLDPERAVESLSHGSHVYAVEQLLAGRIPRQR